MSENTKTFSNKQEKMIAKELGGYQIGMSGAAPTAPGDVKTYEWLIECKTHTTSDHPIAFNLDVWKKIEDEAIGMSRKPVLIVDDGSQKADRTWCLCRSINLNLASVITVDLPIKIKKNISCKHDKLHEVLEAALKPYVGAFFETGAFETNWGGEDVIIAPLATFKELFER